MIDFAVVGGGVAGCVVARTLADTGASVVLFEAGEGALPAELRQANWVDQDDTAWRWPGPYPRGLGLGGGSAINAMVAATGKPSDYDEWPDGWRYRDLAPYFERVLNQFEPWTPPLGPLASALAAVGAEDGTDISPATLLATPAGRRITFADVYLADYQDTLRIETNTPITGLLTSKQTLTSRREALGVIAADGHQTRASHTVVCAGTYGTAGLLARSGIDLGAKEPSDHSSTTLTLDLADGLVSGSSQAPPISAIVRADSFEILIMDHTGGDRRQGAFVVGEICHRGLAAGLNLAKRMAEFLIADDKALGATENPGSYFHTGATTPIGELVDTAGRPEGWTGLHLIDASVLPTLPRCSPSVPLAALAMKMAEQLGAG